MATRKLLCAARLLVAAAMILLGYGTALAGIFTIEGGTPTAIGDRGGTRYSFPPNSHNGQGLPTNQGEWPDGLPGAVAYGFGVDPVYTPGLDPSNPDYRPPGTGYRGISGFANDDGVVLTVKLDVARHIRFTWMGSGNALLVNNFWVDSGSGYEMLFQTPDPALGIFGTVPFLTQERDLPGGVIKFYWKTNVGSLSSQTVANGTNNILGTDSLGHPIGGPSFFAGIDPYLASATPYPEPQRTGSILYLGLSDLAGTPKAGDHDFQDLGIRLEAIGDPIEIPNPVPEPATLTTFLIGLAISGGWAGVRNLRNNRRASAPSR